LAELLDARRRLPPPEGRRKIREDANVSRAVVADAVGVTAAAVGYWESGEREPRPEQLVRYVDVLDTLRDASTAPVAS
jgi:DNA-binding transcriptional regulator YiaG